jgi:hypothetical protein
MAQTPSPSDVRDTIARLSDEKLLDMLDRRAEDYRPEALAVAEAEAARRGGRKTLAQRVAEAEAEADAEAHAERQDEEPSAESQYVEEIRKALTQQVHAPVLAFGVFHLETLHPLVQLLGTLVLAGALGIGVLVALLSLPGNEKASADRQLLALAALGAGFFAARWLIANLAPRLMLALRSEPGAVRWTPWVLLAVTKDMVWAFSARRGAKPRIKEQLGYWPRRAVKVNLGGAGEIAGVELTVPGAARPVELFLVPAMGSGDPIAHLLNAAPDS